MEHLKVNGHIKKLNSYIRKHGKAKVAVALGLKETNAISNWIMRNEVPKKRRKDINLLKIRTVSVYEEKHIGVAVRNIAVEV